MFIVKEDLEMAKINIRERNPEHYAKVKVEQEALIKKCSAQLGIARLCPYCEHTSIFSDMSVVNTRVIHLLLMRNRQSLLDGYTTFL